MNCEERGSPATLLHSQGPSHLSLGVKVLELQSVFRGRWSAGSRTASFNAMAWGPTETMLCERESSEVGAAQGLGSGLRLPYLLPGGDSEGVQESRCCPHAVCTVCVAPGRGWQTTTGGLPWPSGACTPSDTLGKGVPGWTPSGIFCVSEVSLKRL